MCLYITGTSHSANYSVSYRDLIHQYGLLVIRKEKTNIDSFKYKNYVIFSFHSMCYRDTSDRIRLTKEVAEAGLWRSLISSGSSRSLFVCLFHPILSAFMCCHGYLESLQLIHNEDYRVETYNT